MNYMVNIIHVFEKPVVSHRDNLFLCKMFVPSPARKINNHIIILGMIWGDDKWYLMPENNDVLEVVEDVGPFDELDDALIHYKLMSDPI